METKDFLRNRRLELNLTMKDVAKHVGVSEATVSRWESGNIANMKRSRIERLAEILCVSPLSITGIDHSSNDFQAFNFPDILPIKTKKVPLLGTIACGDPILATENIDEYVLADGSVQCDFALRCKGDSMINARIFDGDIVYIRQQADVDNGEIAAILIGDEATIKRVYKYPDRMILQPENPTFPPMVYEGDKLNEIRIIGKAVAFTSVVR